MKHVQLTAFIDEKNTLSQVQASDSTKNHIHEEIREKKTHNRTNMNHEDTRF